MKKLFLFPLFLLAVQLCCAQWTQNEIRPFIDKAEADCKNHKTQMLESDKWDIDDDALRIEFTLDTMRIGRTVHWIEEDGRYSTADMHNTLLFEMAEYDKLLNKYYRLLMDRLSEEDKITFRDAQRAWLKYRDSEAEVNGKIIAPNRYTGGGTMWPLIAGGRNLAIIKERVFGFYEFLTYI